MQPINYDVFISYNSKDILVAEAVCHYIEERKLKCFIAPRDIVPPDWAGSITRAIENSKAFVVIVSENSIMSNEVAKEITLATRVSNYIFPFRIEDAQMNERMTYHLSAYHWIDAISPPMEQRINELADRIQYAFSMGDETAALEVAGINVNKSRNRLITHNVGPRAEFMGREAELEAIETAFESGNSSVFLTGMGGIGKSEIAKAYAKDHRDKYKTVIFANYESDLKQMFASDKTFAVENMVRAVASGGQAETLDEYYERKMATLARIVDEKTLIIIDNFDVDNDEEMERVMSLPCHIIWTTRTSFENLGYEIIKVGPIDDAAMLVSLYEKMDRQYKDSVETEAINEIIEMLDYHTFAISLTAAQGKAGHIKPSKMLEKMREEGLEIKTNSGFVRSATDTSKQTAYAYIEKLFDFNKLSEEACSIMRYMALAPREGVDIDTFMECASVDDFGIIDDMIGQNWIRLDEDNDKINLHMLVTEMVIKKLAPSVDNCIEFLRGIDSKVNNAWNNGYEDNCKMEALVYSVMKLLPSPTKESFDYFESFATFCWIQGNFELAEEYEKKLYDLSVTEWGEYSIHTGSAALRVAAVYHNKADYASARPWYEKGYEIQNKVAPESPQNGVALMKVARCCAQNNDFEKAIDMLGQAEKNYQAFLAIGQAENDSEKIRKANINLAFIHHDLASILANLGQCDRAYELAKASYDYLITESKESSLVIYAMQALAYVLYKMGDYEKAQQYLLECVEKTAYYHGENRIDMMIYLEKLGDCYMQQRSFTKARNYYAKALSNRERLYSADEKSIARLDEKYQNALDEKETNYEMTFMWS